VCWAINHEPWANALAAALEAGVSNSDIARADEVRGLPYNISDKAVSAHRRARHMVAS